MHNLRIAGEWAFPALPIFGRRPKNVAKRRALSFSQRTTKYGQRCPPLVHTYVHV